MHVTVESRGAATNLCPNYHHPTPNLMEILMVIVRESYPYAKSFNFIDFSGIVISNFKI